MANAPSSQTSNKIQADLSGIVLGDPSLPQLLGAPTSSFMGNLTNALQLQGASDRRIWDAGLRLQTYSRRGDLFVFQPTDEMSEDCLVSISASMQLVAQQWEQQLGVELAFPGDGASCFEPAPINQPLHVHVAQRWQPETHCLRVIMLANELLGELEDTHAYQITAELIGKLTTAANLVDLLNHRITAIPLLQDLGIPCPFTINLRDRSELDNLANTVKDATARYVVKADGAIAGLGIHTNGGRGFAAKELPAAVVALLKAQQVFFPLQLQQYVPGDSFCCGTTFLPSQNTSELAIHEQLIRDGTFQGGWWEESLEAQHGDSCQTVLDQLRYTFDGLLGPIYFDFIASPESFSVIEVNPRICAGTPIHMLREELSKREIPTANILLTPPLDTYSMFTSLRALNLAITQTVTHVNRHHAALGPFMLLPTSIAVSPESRTRLLVVNDTAKQGAGYQHFLKFARQESA